MTNAQDTTPAQAEAQDEGAAGLAFKALDVADRIIQREMGMDAPEEWDAAYRAVADARSRENAHPSPPPAADEDRVREALEAAFTGFQIYAGVTIKTIDVRHLTDRALAALKSEGK